MRVHPLRIVAQTIGSDSFPENERPSQAAVRLERVIGDLAGEREPEARVDGRGASVHRCIEDEQRATALRPPPGQADA